MWLWMIREILAFNARRVTNNNLIKHFHNHFKHHDHKQLKVISNLKPPSRMVQPPSEYKALNTTAIY